MITTARETGTAIQLNEAHDYARGLGEFINEQSARPNITAGLRDQLEALRFKRQQIVDIAGRGWGDFEDRKHEAEEIKAKISQA